MLVAVLWSPAEQGGGEGRGTREAVWTSGSWTGSWLLPCRWGVFIRTLLHLLPYWAVHKFLCSTTVPNEDPGRRPAPFADYIGLFTPFATPNTHKILIGCNHSQAQDKSPNVYAALSPTGREP